MRRASKQLPGELAESLPGDLRTPPLQLLILSRLLCCPLPTPRRARSARPCSVDFIVKMFRFATVATTAVALRDNENRLMSREGEVRRLAVEELRRLKTRGNRSAANVLPIFYEETNGPA